LRIWMGKPRRILDFRNVVSISENHQMWRATPSC
jgi:hypothetical protein